MRTALLRLMVLAFAVLAASSVVWASATGTIRGKVIDDGELEIPGALITISSEKLIGGAAQYTTDSEGSFVFPELPPGVYKVQAQKQGFGSVTKSGVQVAVGRNTEVVLQLKYGGETIVIEEKRKTVDTESASKSTTFTREYLSKVPSGRSYQSVISQTAGVVGGGNASSAGAAGNENTWVVDGINVTDPVTGTFSNNFNIDAIEEVRVQTGAYDAEYGNSLGGIFEYVTRSGSNTLEMNLNARYGNGNFGPKMDARLATDGAFLAPTAFDSDYESVDVSGVVAGPIVRDRFWYLASYGMQRGRYTNVGIRTPEDYDGHYVFMKLTLQPVSAHRLTLQIQTDPTTIDNLDQSDRYTLPEAQARQSQGGYLAALKWNWFLNEDTNLETTLSVSKNYLELSGVPCTHDTSLGYNPCEADERENSLDYATPGRLGTYGAFNKDNFTSFQFDDRFRVAATTDFSALNVKFLGKHDFKAGVDIGYNSWNWLTGFTGNLLFVDLYENNFDPNTLKSFYWYEFAGYQEFNADQVAAAAYAQDVYKPVDNLTFRYGLRYDRSVGRDDQGRSLIDVGVFGPRFYAIWDPWGDEKTKVQAGYGRFNDIGRLDITEYLRKSGNGQKLVYGGALDNGTNEASNVYLGVDTSNDFTFGDLSAPHSDEFTAVVQREVVTDFRVGVTFTGKFTRNVYTFDETNLIYDEDGYSFLGASNGFEDLAQHYRLRTPSIARRDYFQVDVELMKFTSKRWFASTTYTYVSSRGTTQSALGGSLSNPSQVELNYGALSSDRNHQVKAQAFWDVPNDPWTTTIGATLEGYSGAPISRYYWQAADTESGGEGGYGLLKEPRGEYARTQPYYTIDVQVEQDFQVPKGKFSAILEVENITNNQLGTSYYSSYVYAQNRYVIASRQAPITATLGAKYEF